MCGRPRPHEVVLSPRWCRLLGVSPSPPTPLSPEQEQEQKREPKPNTTTTTSYARQIHVDVRRSLAHWDVTKAYTPEAREDMRARLERILLAIFSTHAEALHYVQGFHDVVAVFLIVCDGDESLALQLSERLALMHLRDALRPSLESIIESLKLLMPLLRLADGELHAALASSQVQSFFTVSWVLTWFSHDLERFADVCAVFDFLLSSHAMMPLYTAAALVLTLRQGVLDLEELDAPSVHQFFQHLPHNLDVGAVCGQADALFREFPPSELIAAERVQLPPDSPYLVHGGLEHLRAQYRDRDHQQRQWPRLELAGSLLIGVTAVGLAYLFNNYRL